jgi:FkbM family methyltransferase
MTIPKHPNLIIDVGMHDGQDTAFYLAKGFDVVAVEANPQLVEAASIRFAEEQRTGRLRVVSGAIAESTEPQRLAVATDQTIWSSLSPGFVARNEQEQGTRYAYVDVPGVRFEDLLAETGIPHYLKVDIEGLDMLCVRALRHFEVKPDFVSIESAVSSSDAEPNAVFDELAELWTLGYRRFSYVDQATNPHRKQPRSAREGRSVDWTFNGDASGPFGDELMDRWLSPGRALAWAQALRIQQELAGHGGRWSQSRVARLYRAVRRRALRRWRPWYDLHAALGGDAQAESPKKASTARLEAFPLSSAQ